MKVIVRSKVPPLRKIDLFKGSIGKNREGDFYGLRQKIKSLLPLNKDKQFLVIWKEETSLVILKDLSCFTECVNFKRLWSDPKILCCNFQFSVLFEVAIKKIPPKNKTSESAQINTVFVHCICCLSCAEYIRAIYFLPKFE